MQHILFNWKFGSSTWKIYVASYLGSMPRVVCSSDLFWTLLISTMVKDEMKRKDLIRFMGILLVEWWFLFALNLDILTRRVQVNLQGCLCLNESDSSWEMFVHMKEEFGLLFFYLVGIWVLFSEMVKQSFDKFTGCNLLFAN